MNKKVFFPNLDGLRTIAFLAVFLCHSFYTEHEFILDNPVYHFIKRFFEPGLLGVNLFFVLSGFLITYLLLKEEESEGKIDVPNFYLRRILRIWPLYFACVFYGFVVEPFLMELFGKTPNETADPLLFLTFLANFNTIFNGGAEAQNLPVLWSVAIEEQFYLVWPLLLLLFKSNRYVIFIGFIILSTVFRYLHAQEFYQITYHTLGVISDLAIGGLIGYLSFYSKQFISFFEKLKTGQIVFVYCCGFALILSYHHLPSSDIFVAFQRLIYSIFFAFVILEQNYSSNSFFKLGNNKFLSSTGKYTYGLYCLHLIAITASKEICRMLAINDNLFGVIFWQTLLSLTLSFLMAYVSYEFFEKYFLTLKSKFTPASNIVIRKEKFELLADSYNWDALCNNKIDEAYSKSFTFSRITVAAIIQQFECISINRDDTIWGSDCKGSKLEIAKAPGIFILYKSKVKNHLKQLKSQRTKLMFGLI